MDVRLDLYFSSGDFVLMSIFQPTFLSTLHELLLQSVSNDTALIKAVGVAAVTANYSKSTPLRLLLV
jgi:hypothetical protein